MSFITSLFGGAPKVSTQPATDVAEEGKKAKKARSALYATKGAELGEEIQAGGTGGRSTLFGN